MSMVESYTAGAEKLIRVGVMIPFLHFPFPAQYELGTTGFRKAVEAPITSCHCFTLIHVISKSQGKNIDSKIAQGLSLTGPQLGWYIRVFSKK